MEKSKDTIFALSTPVGKSAIAVIRITGDKSYKIIKKLSKKFKKKPNLAQTNTLISVTGEKIDKTITTYFQSPKSYTGEDMVELSVHGSNATIKKIIKNLESFKKTRIAEPGEFTRRAFENNKLDLTQVEAIADLVSSETELQRKQALNQLDGILSKNLKKTQSSIKKILADVEAIIDFVDEELPTNLLTKIEEQKENTIKEIDKTISNSEYSTKIRDGFVVAIVGPPNTGKSSFINKISNQEISIVTNHPGTTRDALESYLDINGLPVRFYDTAGIRKSKNQIEKMGISKSITISKKAHTNLVFVGKKSDIEDFKYMKNTIFVKSKSDLKSNFKKTKNVEFISSKTGKGIKPLLKKISKRIAQEENKESPIISRERHKKILQNTKKHLLNANPKKNIDIYAENIRLSLTEMSKIYGRVDIEDILDIIFTDFCIGK